MKKIKTITLGCKVNQYESEAISEALSNIGYEYSEKNAEITIVNTCAVTQKAAMQSRQAIRAAIRSKKDKKNSKVVVTGCYAETEPEEIKKIEGIDIITGNLDKAKLHEIIKELDEKGKYKTVLYKDIFSEKTFPDISATGIGKRNRPFLKIQDGCDTFCTYCIVPYARGKSRSMPEKKIMRYLEDIASLSYKEVVLTGIHLGNWGKDLNPASDLLSLIKKIDKKRIVHRVRLTSIEPNELTEEMIQYIAGSDTICDHFHIPLQSGDDKILEKMKRPYKAKEFANKVKVIEKLLPHAAIGVDIIVGFPGETEESFEKSYSLIDSLPVSYLHVFPYSARKKTPASKFQDQVNSKVKKERAGKIRRLGNIKKNIFYNKQKNYVFEAIIENKKVTTSNYLPVYIEENCSGNIVNVKIAKVTKDNKIFGRIV